MHPVCGHGAGPGTGVAISTTGQQTGDCTGMGGMESWSWEGNAREWTRDHANDATPLCYNSFGMLSKLIYLACYTWLVLRR